MSSIMIIRTSLNQNIQGDAIYLFILLIAHAKLLAKLVDICVITHLLSLPLMAVLNHVI